MTDSNKVKAVYVITGQGEKKFWNKVGVAFVNRDGSLNVKLDSLPIDGELHIRDMESKEERDARRGEDTPPASAGKKR